MSEVVTFGELMLKLSPPGYKRFVQTDSFDVFYGGAEANVAVSLANYGIDCAFITKLPKNQIGDSALNFVRRFGVNTTTIARGGERLGIFFAEKGASQRPSLVIYDRKHSAMQNAEPKDFDWETIFADTKYFHFTGITPALGDSCAAICLEACKKAKEKGITISCDINYRAKLWDTAKASQVMTGLMDYVDICIANEEDAEKVFGIKGKKSDVEKGQIDLEDYKGIAAELAKKFSLSKVAMTLRKSISASDNIWSALLYTGGTCYTSRSYDIRLVDRMGGGDSFAAGLIYSTIKNKTPQESIDFATAASCLKQTIEGDFNQVSVEEVEKLAAGNTSGRISR